MKLTGAQILVETLIEMGTDTVFGYPGGQVLNIYDELYKNAHRIRHILTAHEQGAVHAADGFARATGKTGVVIATSGPGATNLVTGIATAHLDSIPLVAITGNVSCNLIGRDSFQEVDIVGITLPVTKHNYMVKRVEDLADTIREAFMLASSGRPGPVLIDIPKDVQSNMAEFTPSVRAALAAMADQAAVPDETEIVRAAEMIAQSRKPYIYCGGGVLSADAGAAVMRLAETIDAPIGLSMMGLSAIPTDFPYNLGMTGMHGHYASIKAKADADLILALGVRFSDRATGDKSKYAAGAGIIHIDVDPAEIDKNIPSTLGIEGNVREVLERLLAKLTPKTRPAWHGHIDALRQYEHENACPMEGALTPYAMIDAVNARISPDTPVVTDVGQHQMWAAQRALLRQPRTFITSGGLGTMGFGMGAAIGAAIATGRRTVLYTGDGSFGMNLNELATAVAQNVPLVIMIMNNGVLGMVRQWQTIFYAQHYAQSTLDRKTDFVRLAEAFGAVGMRARDEASLHACLDRAFTTDGPVVIDCVIDPDVRVLPMIPPNASVDSLIMK